jgi:prophage antirepressor-like protein
MDTELKLFTNEEFGGLHVIEIDGQPWFIGKEVAKSLGYERADNAIRTHVDEDDKLTHQISASGQNRQMFIINESGLYSLILSSKLPAAKKFKRWITSEVIPSIRKHGAYITENTLREMINNPKYNKELLQILLEERIVLNEKIADLEPKAQYCDVILRCKNAVPISVIAKDYGLSAVALNKILHKLKIQYRVGRTWILYQDHADKGYTKSLTHSPCDGVVVVNTLWLQRGRLFLYDELKAAGILPLIESPDK